MQAKKIQPKYGKVWIINGSARKIEMKSATIFPVLIFNLVNPYLQCI